MRMTPTVVIYVGGPCKARDLLRLAGPLIRTQFSFLSSTLLVKLHSLLHISSLNFA